MAELDRFGGPEAWDAECDEEDKRYAALIDGKTCLDCSECELPEGDDYEGIGWCLECGEFVYNGETIAQLGLECFRGR